jgi:hypothetical protein
MALARCIEIYSPIGFQATWAFLQARVGDFRSDPQSMVSAVALLDESRRVRIEEELTYREQRREAKRLGHRTPPPAETSPDRPRRWHAAPHEAARFVLDWHRQRHDATGWSGDEVEQEVLRLLDLAADEQGAKGTAALADARQLLAPRLTRDHYQENPGSYYTARRLGALADHVQVILGGY